MLKMIFSSVLPVFLLVFLSSCNQVQIESEINTIDKLRTNFVDPPSAYRSAPLWVWHEKITEEKIDFQMKEFKKAGIGGVFVHPRPGLLTEYLSEEWFDLFDYAIEKAKELDMKVWIYDENSYPSGFAGGHVPAEMPDSYKHGSGLAMDVQQVLDIEMSDTIEVVLKKSGEGLIEVTDVVVEELGKTGPYYIFRKTYMGTSPWYGGHTYVDLLYKGVTEKFIDITMTKGYERNAVDFGETLPGIFTDEPNLEQALPRGSVMRYTPELWDLFQERWGYDLRKSLPSLVEETGNWKKVRHDYYVLILELFIDRWAKPWYEYCEENNLKWTGHYWEHGWPTPTHGFDESAFYIYHQQPGVDMLGWELKPYGQGGQFGNDRAIRELRSAANQAGWVRTLSETYGGAGWEFNFEEQKRLADWQGVLGVNFVNQHLSYVSMKGVRKFDYPPSFSYHEPWWEHYSLMGDYIGRISLATSAGAQINTTLVLQPNTSAWMYFSRQVGHEQINAIRTGFKDFVYQLENRHVEYDLGSEYVLRTIGSVSGDQLTVGKRDYSLVVIPEEMENIDRATIDMIETYLENGGKILAYNANIRRVDGEKSDEPGALAAKYSQQWIQINSLDDSKAMELLGKDDFQIKDLAENTMLYHQRRILEDGQLIFAVNSHQQETAVADITTAGKQVVKMDLLSGEEYVYPSESKKGKVTFHVELAPVGSALFYVGGKVPGDLKAYSSPAGAEKTMEMEEGLTVEREDENVLVVNFLDLKTRKSTRKGIYFMNALIDLFKENGIAMGNPWQHKIQYKQDYLDLDTLFDARSAFEVNYHFQISPDFDQDAMKDFQAVVERAEFYNVTINGHKVSEIEDAYWIDKDFPRFPVGPYLKPGKNTITLHAPRMHILAEVMPVYILGDFLVKPAKAGYEIVPGEFAETGSWAEAGLPFYSQNVAYTRKIDLQKSEGAGYKVKLNDWNGTIAGVSVNGEDAGVIAWKPYELDISSLLKDGENDITVSVTGSLKNTFGYFFRENTGGLSGPFSWNIAPESMPPASGYFLEDYGLFEPFEVVAVE